MKSIKKKREKVAILGTEKSWKEAPLKDPNWEIWGMNSFWKTWGEYATRWFEIHQLPILHRDGWEYYKWLKECPIPVYMAKHYKCVPNSISFPFAKVSAGFMRQFSSTFCYEMALAIYEGFKTIGLYGIGLPNGSLRERVVEYRGLLYWLGVAAGRGINIEFGSDTEKYLRHKYLYGIDYWNEIFDVQNQILRNYYACSKIDGVGSTKRIWQRLDGEFGIKKRQIKTN